MDAQISWRELGSPSEPGNYPFAGTHVRVTRKDIDLAERQFALGASDVVFNATLFDGFDFKGYELAGIAGVAD
jgi:hypothetical protein